MDENQKLYEKRHIQKPIPYFAAKKDEWNNTYGQEHEAPDYFIRKDRDIDQEGMFLNQRIF